MKGAEAKAQKALSTPFKSVSGWNRWKSVWVFYFSARFPSKISTTSSRREGKNIEKRAKNFRSLFSAFYFLINAPRIGVIVGACWRHLLWGRMEDYLRMEIVFLSPLENEKFSHLRGEWQESFLRHLICETQRKLRRWFSSPCAVFFVGR